jgi:hypothetical protein
MRLFWLPLAALTACGPAPLSTDLTTGVQVAIDGCPFTVTTPNETTAPLADDGRVGATPNLRAQHVAFRGDPSTSMTVVWETDFDTSATRVAFGPDASYGQTRAGFSYAYPTDDAGLDPPSVRVHEVSICGLQPGTTYHYSIQTGVAATADATFTTAPAAGSSFRLMVLGDSRDSTSIFAQALQAGVTDGAEAAVFTGDAVLLGIQQDLWDAWFTAVAPILPSLTLAFALGNHEADARHVFAQFPGPGNQQWYSFDWGDVHFVVLNDSPIDMTTITGPQAAFLDADLAASTKLFKIVVHHKPVYTSYEGPNILGHMHETVLEQSWVPLFEQHGVDVVLNGHVHGFERTFPLQGGQPVADGRGPVYFVFGGAGATQVPLMPETFIAKQSMNTYGYQLLDVSGRTLTITVKSIDGSVLDKYSITK